MTDNHINKLPNGSIDYDFYRARGREARSKQAHALLGSAWKRLRSLKDIVALTAKWITGMLPRNTGLFTSGSSHA